MSARKFPGAVDRCVDLNISFPRIGTPVLPWFSHAQGPWRTATILHGKDGAGTNAVSPGALSVHVGNSAESAGHDTAVPLVGITQYKPVALTAGHQDYYAWTNVFLHWSFVRWPTLPIARGDQHTVINVGAWAAIRHCCQFREWLL